MHVTICMTSNGPNCDVATTTTRRDGAEKGRRIIPKPDLTVGWKERETPNHERGNHDDAFCAGGKVNEIGSSNSQAAWNGHVLWASIKMEHMYRLDRQTDNRWMDRNRVDRDKHDGWSFVSNLGLELIWMAMKGRTNTIKHMTKLRVWGVRFLFTIESGLMKDCCVCGSCSRVELKASALPSPTVGLSTPYWYDFSVDQLLMYWMDRSLC